MDEECKISKCYLSVRIVNDSRIIRNDYDRINDRRCDIVTDVTEVTIMAAHVGEI